MNINIREYFMLYYKHNKPHPCVCFDPSFGHPQGCNIYKGYITETSKTNAQMYNVKFENMLFKIL